MSTHSDLRAVPQLEAVTLVELLRWRAVHEGDRRAFTFLSEKEEEISWTYEELDRRARAIAAELQSLGAEGARALLLYPPGLDYIAGFLGCLYAGVIAVPAYPPDPSRLDRTLPRLHAIVADCGATLALTTKSVRSLMKLVNLKTRLSGSLGKVPVVGKRLGSSSPEGAVDAGGLASLRWIATDGEPSGAETVWKEPDVRLETVAFLQYTSGSTGTPRGVMVSHENLLHNSTLIRAGFGFTPESEGVSWLPMYHDMGLIGCVLVPIFVGCPCTLMSPLDFLRWPTRWLRVISRIKDGSVISGGPNFAYDLCVRKVRPEHRETLDLSHWHLAFNGAEPIRASTLEAFTEAFSPCGFRKEAFYPCYGLAEATLFVSGGFKESPPVVHTLDKSALERGRVVDAPADADGAYQLVGCGQALLDQQIEIVDPDSRRRCGPGEVGEIWVRSASVARGYWNRPAESEQTFGGVLADTGEGPFLRTGDLGYLRDKQLYVTGRLKDLIILRGRNHYPQDIEETVWQSHSAVRAGCGAAFSVEVEGEERLVVVQEVRLRRGLDFSEVMSAIRQSVAEAHGVQVYGVMLLKPRTIPKTSSGKIRRRACRSGYLSGTLAAVAKSVLEGQELCDGALGGEGGLPEVSREELAGLSAAERRRVVEQYLVEWLSGALGVAGSALSVDRPLSTMGLDSLQAVELANEVESSLGVRLPIASVLEAGTVSGLAAHVVAEMNGGLETVAAGARHSDEDREVALSQGQRAMWFQHQLAPDSIYNIAYAVRIRSEVDVEALHRAFQTLVDRHGALRTTFPSRQGEPLQRVAAQAEVCFRVEDATGLADSELAPQLEAEAHKPFDLERGPLFRVTLFRRSSEEFILVLSAHHIVVDLWSLTVLLEELHRLYRGETANLRAVEAEYADYVAWEATRLSEPEADRLWEYWREKLSEALPLLNLPTDRPRPVVQTFRGASEIVWLEGDLLERLKELGARHGATLYMTLLAAFKVLLHRYTGQEDLIVGSPTLGRGRSEWSRVVGYFVNPVALRTRAEGSSPFTRFLEEVRQSVLEALAHQEYPFSLLVEKLQPKRDPSRTPIFQVMFVLQKAQLLGETGLSAFALGEEGVAMELGGLMLESVPLGHRSAPFDLTLMVAEARGGLAASLQYNADLYESATVRRMLGHYRRLLESIVSEPEQRLSRLELLTPSERRELVADWNATERPLAAETTMHRMFEEQVARTPHAVAVTHGECQVTYGELNRRANQLAHHLQGLGVGPEVLVGILVDRSVEMVVSVLAVLKAGGAYVPLDPGYPAERLAYMMEDAEVSVLVTESKLLGRLPVEGTAVVCLDRDRAEIAVRPATNPHSSVVPENLAYVIYTSGSTGRPKGVMLAHRGLCNLSDAQTELFHQSVGDRILQFSPSSFDASVWEIIMALRAGATLCLADRENLIPGSGLSQVLQQDSITTATFPPSILAALPHDQRLPLDTIVVAGERCSADLVDRWSPGRRFFNAYGPTEGTVCATVHHCAESSSQGPPIGRPILNMKTYLLHPEHQLVPVGVPGELFIGGIGLARGYHRRPELTAEKFVPDPFSSEPGARLYRSGDLARYRSDGSLEFLGRLDHQVKIRGFRIELGEIEAILAEHPGVREAVVLAKEEVAGDQRLVACLVPESESSTDGDELRQYLRQRLPEYMVPSGYVILEALPMTPSGKVDRQALLRVNGRRLQRRGPQAMPQTEIERTVATIWEEVLRVDRVGVDDNFFDLGGHSLHLAQVQSRLKEQFDGQVSMVDLFKYPTVRTLAEYLSRGQGPTRSFRDSQDRAQRQRQAMGRQRQLLKDRR